MFAALLQEIHASLFKAFIENVDFLQSPSLYVFLELPMFYINLMVLIQQNGVKRKLTKLIMSPDPFSYLRRKTTWNYYLYLLTCEAIHKGCDLELKNSEMKHM